MTKLDEALVGIARLGMETARVKHLTEANPRYDLPVNASLRARDRQRIPDSLQIATSLQTGFRAFPTNDASLRQVSALRVPVLEDLIE